MASDIRPFSKWCQAQRDRLKRQLGLTRRVELENYAKRAQQKERWGEGPHRKLRLDELDHDPQV